MTVDPKFIAVLEPLVRRVRTDATAIWVPDRGILWTDDALNERTLIKHLNGGPARGVAPIKPGEDTTMVAVLDLDSHKGEATWDEMAEAAERVTAELVMAGMVPNPWRSRGGNGIHLIILWDEPQDAYSVREELREVLAEAGFKPGSSGGIKNGRVEVFPKQDRVDIGSFGNQFILPLAGKSEPLVPVLGYEPGGREMALTLPWYSSAPVRKREKPAPVVRAGTIGTASQAERALAAIPNDIDDRDEWFVLMCAAKEAGVSKEAAREWTAQHPSYTDEGFDVPWDSIEVGRPDGTPAAHLFNLAERHGWTELIEAEFPVVEREAVSAEPAPLPVFKRDKQGAIEPTVTNTVMAVGRGDLLGFRLAHDSFRDDMLIGHSTSEAWRPVTDADMVSIRMALERIGFKAAPKELTRDAAVRVAADNVFDTAINWINSLKWDGVPRVERFMVDYLGVADTPYSRAVALYTWTALAGRCIEPGVQADMAPILQGGQGLGKTSVIRAIAPNPEFYVEVDFNTKEEDTVRSLRGVLVAEIAELSGLHTKALETIKKFITRRTEKWVPKYREFPHRFDRRVVFIGTTNEVEILADSTGNRRWLPVTVTKADAAGVERDKLQLWAEGAELFRKHGVMWETAFKLANMAHEDFRMRDSWEDTIAAWLELPVASLENSEGAKNSEVPFTLEDVMRGALGIVTAQQDWRCQRRTADSLKALGYESTTVRIGAYSKPARRWKKRAK